MNIGEYGTSRLTTGQLVFILAVLVTIKAILYI